MKAPISFSKGLILLGGIGGPAVFLGTRGLTLGGAKGGREVEITSNYAGTNWNDGIVTPVFDSWWLSGGFKNPVKYSYSYIARPVNTDYSNSTLAKHTKKGSNEAEGELRLVERVGSFKDQSGEQGGKGKKFIPHQHLNGLTTKKFILVGVNRTSKEVELAGLVSLVKVGHKGIQKNCHQKEEGKDKAIQNGFCDDVFFKEYYSESEKPKFIETQLKNSSDSQVGVLGFNLPAGGTLSVIFGGGKLENGTSGGGSRSETRWSRSGVVRVSYTGTDKQQKNQNLFVGPIKQTGQNYNRPYVVVHDLIFTQGSIGEKYKEAERGTKSLIELGQSSTSTTNGYALASSQSTIPLDTRRQYYLWDPSYTHIKNGKLETKDGHKLPWNVHIELPYKTELVK